MRSWLGVLILVASLAGCNSVSRTVAFDEAEFAPFAGPGDGTVSGRIVLTRIGEEQQVGAGSTVYLTPVTRYTTEWYEQAIVKRVPLADNDPRLRKYQRTTTTDARGNYEFKNVPAGDYYLTCLVTTTNQHPYDPPAAEMVHGRLRVKGAV